MLAVATVGPFAPVAAVAAVAAAEELPTTRAAVLVCSSNTNSSRRSSSNSSSGRSNGSISFCGLQMQKDCQCFFDRCCLLRIVGQTCVLFIVEQLDLC
ncbi:hypothetical protein Emed_007590 [Eimeria media]